MSVRDAILTTQPTSYWPLDDLSGSSSCYDEMGLHDASLPSAGVTLSVLPFGTSQAPFFDGALGSVLTIPDDPQYSQPFSDALTVAAWLCPSRSTMRTWSAGKTGTSITWKRRLRSRSTSSGR